MLKNIIKYLIYICILCLIILLSFFVILKNYPQYISKVKPYVEYKLSNIYPNTKAEINDLNFVINHGNIEIKATDVKFIDNVNHRVLLDVNKIFFQLDIKKLLTGEIIFSKTVISDLNFNFIHADSSQKIKKKFDQNFSDIIYNIKWHKIPIDVIKFTNLNIKINQQNKENFIKINQAEMSVVNSPNLTELSTHIEANVDSAQENTIITSSFKVNNKAVESNIKFNNLPSYIITELTPYKIVQEKLNLNLNGHVEFSIDNKADFNKLEFKVENSKGLLNDKNIDDINLTLLYHDKRLDIINLTTIFDQSAINILGSIKFNDDFSNLDDIDISTNVDNFKIDNLGLLWPEQLYTMIRSWILENITKGVIQHLNAKFVIPGSDIAEKTLKAGSIEGIIDFTNLNVKYYQDLPKLENVSGTVKFDNKSFGIITSGGKILNSNIKFGNVKINFDESPIVLQVKTEGNIRDLIEFIPKEDIESAKAKNVDLKNIDGNALTDLTMSIPITNQNKASILVKSQINKLKLENLLKNHRIDDGEFLLTFNGSKTEIKGKALLDQNFCDIDWISNYNKNNKLENRLILDTILSSKNVNALFPKHIVADKGNINVKTIVISKDNKDKIDISMNLNEIDFKLSKLGYHKPSGQNLEAIISATTQENNIIVDKVNIHGKDVFVKGTAILDNDRFNFVNIDLDKVEFDNNNFKLHYKFLNNISHINIIGKYLNLGKVDFKNLSESNDEHMNYIVDANIDFTELKNNHNFTNLNLKAEYFNNMYTHIDASAFEDKGYSNSIILKQTDLQNFIFEVESANLGRLLKAFDIYDNFKAGQLKITGKKIINNNLPIYEGTIHIKNFIVKKTPVFSKIFTFTSLPKIVELPFALLPGESISSNDIPFTNLRGKFSYIDHIVYLKNTTVEGPQLGLTINGNIDFAKSQLNIGGTVIPELLGISKIINNIPIIGSLLQGGKNKGLVATSYSVKGNFKNLHSFVNPLSMLTPGFLRNIFNIFEDNRNQR